MKTLASLLALFLFAALTLAPSYNAAPPPDVYAGSCATLFSAEQPTTGTFSQQFHVTPPESQKPAPIALSFELAFAGNPGAFNIQIQDADTDATGNYVTLPTAGTVTSCPVTAGGSFTCRVELSPWRANFGRLYVQTQAANAVNLTAKVCR